MNRSCLFLFFGLSLMLLCKAMGPVLANAPATAKIVFNSTVDGNAEIYMMNPDGSQRVRLTNHPARDMAPAWSPTGEQIIFTSDRDGKWRWGGCRAIVEPPHNRESLKRVGYIHFLLKRDVEHAMRMGFDVKSILTDNE